jgi:hypothetical protein
MVGKLCEQIMFVDESDTAVSTSEVVYGAESGLPPPDVGRILDRARGVVSPALRAAVDRLPVSMRTLAGYHFGWQDRHGTPMTADAGKVVRPALVLLVTEAVGGTPTQALPAAVAVELIHTNSTTPPP